MLTRRRDERGGVAIMVAVLASVLFVTAALVVDLGLARDTRRQAVNAADASALAAANALFPAEGTCTTPLGSAPPCYVDAVNAAKAYGSTNYGVSEAAWTACTDPSKYYVLAGHTPCVSFTDDTRTTALPSKPTVVRVRIPTRTLDTGLGALADVETISVPASALASVRTTAAVAYAIFAINRSPSCGDKTLEINGNSFEITGSVHSNGGGKINGNDITIDGSVHTVSSSDIDGDIDVTGTETSGPPVRPNPLNPDGNGERIELWRPGSARAIALGTKYHNMGSTTVTRSTVLSRGAGVYYTTKDVDLSGGPLLANVTFVIDRTIGEKVFHANGNDVKISSYLDPVNNPNDIQVITNAAGDTGSSACDKTVVHINGGNFSYRGAIYAPNGHVHLNGNNHRSTDGSIIAMTLKINGNDAGVATDVDLSVGEADIALAE